MMCEAPGHVEGILWCSSINVRDGEMEEWMECNGKSICTSNLKKICRENGLDRWPHRRLEKASKKSRGMQLEKEEGKSLSFQRLIGRGFLEGHILVPSLGYVSATSVRHEYFKKNQEWEQHGHSQLEGHVHLSVSLATPYFGYNRVGVEVNLWFQLLRLRFSAMVDLRLGLILAAFHIVDLFSFLRNMLFFVSVISSFKFCRTFHLSQKKKSHIAVECNSTTMCWNCKEPGHLAGQFPYEPVCNMCGKMGHLARDCLNPRLPAHDARLCNNCYKAGHFAADCTNEKACNNCHEIGHLGHDCHNKPVCNICNISGHVARQCAKSKLSSDIGGHFRDIVCRNCGQLGHISQDCVSIVICSNCGGRGHLHYECPSARMYDRSGVRRY
ncbi:hypothetical protein GOBAR_DD00897 [Gossypium barbadense]|nr:hypothetical protein GOBAR_DD00897 [Gossypium barbadense]